MPLVKIYLREGRDSAFLDSVGTAIHDALVAEANVPADDRFQLFHELGEGRLHANPTYAGVERSADLLVIEITLNAGRTVDTKKKLYAAIVANLERVDVRPDDVLVSLVEVARENWSFGRGLATYA